MVFSKERTGNFEKSCEIDELREEIKQLRAKRGGSGLKAT
jgi:hypothetical protein